MQDSSHNNNYEYKQTTKYLPEYIISTYITLLCRERKNEIIAYLSDKGYYVKCKEVNCCCKPNANEKPASYLLVLTTKSEKFISSKEFVNNLVTYLFDIKCNFYSVISVDNRDCELIHCGTNIFFPTDKTNRSFFATKY